MMVIMVALMAVLLATSGGPMGMHTSTRHADEGYEYIERTPDPVPAEQRNDKQTNRP